MRRSNGDRTWRPGDAWQLGAHAKGYNLEQFRAYLEGSLEFDTSTRKLVEGGEDVRKKK